MELTEFVKHFADLFDDTDASEIKADTAFHDLEEWGSLLVMGVIAMAKTKYGKTVTGKEIQTCETVEDLYHTIASK
jgi:acyl carrier protein